MLQKPFISVVSPVFNNASTLVELVERIEKTLSQLNKAYEIILVDDGSSDESWHYIEQLAHRLPLLKALRLSRNFGQHHAITAGVDIAAGEWVVIIDADLEEPPEAILHLLEEAQRTQSEIILARRQQRQHSWLKQLSSRIFYRLLRWLSGYPYDPLVANFGLYHCSVIQAIRCMREPIRFFPALVQWVGFQSGYIDITHTQRPGKGSSYSWHKRLRLAVDLLLTHSARPMELVVQAGFLCATMAFLLSIVMLVRYYMGYIVVLGYTSLIISIWFIGGLLMIGIGMLGLYLSKVFISVQQRPLYIVRQHLNIKP